MKAPSLPRRIRTVLVGGAVVAMGLAVVPANAATVPPPVVRGTSLAANNTWSRINNIITVDYNREIDVAASTITLTDGTGATILPSNVDADNDGRPDGIDTAHVVDQTKTPPQRLEADLSIFYFIPAAALTQEDGPYTATFTAHSLNQTPSTADTVSIFTFNVDTKVPTAPTIAIAGGQALPRSTYPSCGTPAAGCGGAYPSNPIPSAVTAVAPGETVRLSGLAKDILDAQGNPDFTSGIAKVNLHFYAGAAVRPSSGTPGSPGYNPNPITATEDPTLAMTLQNACTATLCETQLSYQATPTLPRGYWSVRASTEDLAGNRSGQSDPIAVLVVS